MKLRCREFLINFKVMIIEKIVGKNFHTTFSSMLRRQPNTVHFGIFTTLHVLIIKLRYATKRTDL